MTNCVVFAGWSIFTRVIEHFNVRPTEIEGSNVSEPDGPDAVYILGRSNSVFILEGSRRDIKTWTIAGLTYKDSVFPSAVIWRALTRVGSFMVLLLVFTTIPNGSTTDQLAFILLNALGQVNLLLGQQLNSTCRLSELKLIERAKVQSRTEVYGMLLRRFKDVGNGVKDWLEKADLLPRTDAWKIWSRHVVEDYRIDPKVLYQSIITERLDYDRSDCSAADEKTVITG
ncbi:hypothetical protein P152DRAFT_460848 [Eremomyces bilateralis CBS 781.70]|uniref:Uncharacterized protein n=1 Tax=Eremomyces bilateralis CBS 781.70 TaxID=1392243 RepID=A0A6G1FW71_9PEZI|nr:uncharacterized protein P152DRAFT_460848 [Eremomyces bilateralis CBS 781.70]KAF1810034.1 hypothetical protein P152DRAFT_460848 [Eremomyces bilateralis CBS 781.70]